MIIYVFRIEKNPNNQWQQLNKIRKSFSEIVCSELYKLQRCNTSPMSFKKQGSFYFKKSVNISFEEDLKIISRCKICPNNWSNSRNTVAVVLSVDDIRKRPGIGVIPRRQTRRGIWAEREKNMIEWIVLSNRFCCRNKNHKDNLQSLKKNLYIFLSAGFLFILLITLTQDRISLNVMFCPLNQTGSGSLLQETIGIRFYCVMKFDPTLVVGEIQKLFWWTWLENIINVMVFIRA